VSGVSIGQHHDDQQGRHLADLLAVPGLWRNLERRAPRRAVPSEVVLEVMSMADHKLAPRPSDHSCPVCHFPQTKIQRKLGDEKQGATNYVCARAGECAIGIDLRLVDTWVAV
jgi:hypothetical protein